MSTRSSSDGERWKDRGSLKAKQRIININKLQILANETNIIYIISVRADNGGSAVGTAGEVDR